jgi:transposase
MSRVVNSSSKDMLRSRLRLSLRTLLNLQPLCLLRLDRPMIASQSQGLHFARVLGAHRSPIWLSSGTVAGGDDGSAVQGCGGEERVKNGFMRGKQRYRCKACGLNFTDTPPRGMPLQVRATAVLLYVSGLSMNRIAKLLGVSTPSVMAWIERFAKDHAPKPEPEGRALVIELDEMWHYLKKSRTSSGSGRLGIVLQADWLTGNAAVVIAPPWSGSSPA